ncbi:hypothetical protein [Methylorubrum populi]|uniref:hypothetical protein n=1 Tax=Methylorubrum populi TaxID=223967 RepID=UPI000DB8B20E|nr:hypothetical protein [Methylorubrum populi]PZP71769.1 MAG: hypothetical protein DI590_05775 [Methylorubrum populi]
MYKIARSSTIRMITDTIQPWGAQLLYTDWDAHAESFQLPGIDLVGLVGFSCSENDTFHDITFGIAVMVLDDPHLERATDYIDTFYKRLAAQSRYPMFNPDGTETGFEAVIFEGTSVSPMTRVDYRPTTEITASARVTRAGQWPPK